MPRLNSMESEVSLGDVSPIEQALFRKRVEVVSHIEAHQQQLRDLIAELDHLDATIRVFSPEAELSTVQTRPARARYPAYQGEMTGTVFRVLRERKGKPTTSRDIAKRLMKDRGLRCDDRDLMIIITKRVLACLRVQRNKGLVCNVPIEGTMLGWGLVPNTRRSGRFGL